MVATNLQISLILTSEEKLLTTHINTLIIQNQVKSLIQTHFFEDFKEVSFSLFIDYNVRSLASNLRSS